MCVCVCVSKCACLFVSFHVCECACLCVSTRVRVCECAASAVLRQCPCPAVRRLAEPLGSPRGGRSRLAKLGKKNGAGGEEGRAQLQVDYLRLRLAGAYVLAFIMFISL